MNSSYSQLLVKLDDFIRKYYKSKWTLGLLYLFCASIGLFVLFSTMEYFGYYQPHIKIILLLIFFVVILCISIGYILIPFMAYKKLGKRIDYPMASRIIGEHFPLIKDKLLNTIQLHELSFENSDSSLIEASIDQKVLTFQAIPFFKAIDQKRNGIYFKALGVLVFFTTLLTIFFPSLLSQGSGRILAYRKEFAPPAPFTFIIKNKNLNSFKNGNFLLEISLEGNSIPEEVFLDNGTILLPCVKTSTTSFSYYFNNLQSDVRFRLSAAGFFSPSYTILVHPVPIIQNFLIKIQYPNYLHRSNGEISNTGDLLVPEGSHISWEINTLESDSLLFEFKGKKHALQGNHQHFEYTTTADQDFEYFFIPKNRFTLKPDSFRYQVNTIKDAYPQIVTQDLDSSKIEKKIYFNGSIKDDYGFNRLVFHYFLSSSDNKKSSQNKGEDFTIIVPINKDISEEPFSMTLNLDKIPNATGKEITCYFEVFDNDGFHGPKSTRSSLQKFYLQNIEEDMKTQRLIEKSSDSEFKKASTLANQLNADTKNLYQKILQSKEMTFDDKQTIKDLLNENKDLDSSLKKINRENTQTQELRNSKENKSKSLSQKEADMKKLLNDLISKDTKNLLEKLSKLLEQNNLGETKQTLKDFNLENKSLANEIKRAEQLYKELVRDREIQNQIDLLSLMAKKEKELSEKNGLKNQASTDDLKKQESEQQKAFNNLKKNLEDIEKNNSQDHINQDFKVPTEQENSISKSQEKTQDALSKKDIDKASKQQKETSDKMYELGNQLAQMKQTLDAKALSINLHSLRIILENLLRISFKQEALMAQFKERSSNDPSIVKYTQEQSSLKEAIKHVMDSLDVLSKKVPPLQSSITKEIGVLNSDMEQLTGLLADRRLYEAEVKQQYIMTSINNLALVLSHVEKQMAGALSKLQGSGDGKEGSPSLSSLVLKQKNLNSRLGKMGSPTKEDGEGDNESLIRLADEQEFIRKEIENLSHRAESRGKLASDLGQIQKEMQESETDLLNKRINQKITIRQKEILTRMLESEKAEKAKEMDNKLQAEASKNYSKGIIKPLAIFPTQKVSLLMPFNTMPYNMSSYYKFKINTYFNLLNNSQSRNEKLGDH